MKIGIPTWLHRLYARWLDRDGTRSSWRTCANCGGEYGLHQVRGMSHRNPYVVPQALCPTCCGRHMEPGTFTCPSCGARENSIADLGSHVAIEHSASLAGLRGTEK